ncbi:hypothetical protein BDQ12DRAFT_717221 [Crucibulum laeve]|uniref:Zn(2)-C6 fungal-type domain-containing protein n=1 Tax=Crucibulum laeve TaxID=68775 RepID=A0A5C3MGJ5_9AGAR|nr:hypothetical protein BDQ12DRAFT_717221 [Crucibulum laeve]
MVASVNSDLYSPFQQHIMHEEGPQSSEEGSGLHSPVYSPYAPPHGDNFRYQQPDHLDVHHSAAAILAPQFDYTHSLNNIQQPPILDTRLELPSPPPSARHVTFPSHPYSLPPRNQLGLDFPVQTSVHSRIPHTAHGGGPNVDFRYNSASERRLPGGPSHDHSYPRPGSNSAAMPMDSDHRQPLVNNAERVEPSVAGVASTSRESRKEISSVVIACRQCRGRKIRCDSTRPVCNNCVRRSNVCEYDAQPKRRGPDKRPGTRQRSCKKRPADGSAPPPPKRKRTTAERSSEARESAPSNKVKENMASDLTRSPSLSRHSDRSQDSNNLQQSHNAPPNAPLDLRISTDPALLKQELSPTYRRHPTYGYEQGYVKSSFPRQLDVNTFQSPNTPHTKFPGPTSPAVETGQRLWWDKILGHYAKLETVVNNITFLIDNTGHLLSFINVDFLVKRLWDDEARHRIQPSFILAGLALAQLMKSSCLEEGPKGGLSRAMALKNEAQAAFRESYTSGWIDATLAEAALILAIFESSAYPGYSYEAAGEALVNLDNVIRAIQLTTIDANDSDVSQYPQDSVPSIIIDEGPEDPLYPASDRKCTCLPPDAISPADPYSNRPYSLPWDPSWTADEIRNEEIRRLCWSALSLVSNYSAQCAAFNRPPPRLHLNEPSNYVLLFPGEVTDRVSMCYRGSDSPSPKESVWALYCRSMLLWNFCNRFRDETMNLEDKAENASEAWVEAQAIYDSLNMHNCNLDTTLIYMCREYIYNTRLLVTQALRSLQGIDSGPRTTPGPIFKRAQAEDWLYYQQQVIERVNATIHHLTGPEGYQLTRRPFRASWFLNQLAICIILWTHDQTLIDALKLAKMIMPAVDVMNVLWPCTANINQSEALRKQVGDACAIVGIDPPFPPSYTLPSCLT